MRHVVTVGYAATRHVAGIMGHRTLCGRIWTDTPADQVIGPTCGVCRRIADVVVDEGDEAP
jgi:hypothetical protein